MKLTVLIASLNLILLYNLANRRATGYEHYLLSCGGDASVSNSQGFGGRTWYSDNNSTYSPSFSSTSTASTVTSFDVDKIPFATARVFTTNFTYSFPVSTGPKFIRLFFYPSRSPYKISSSSSSTDSLDTKDAYLTVQANSDHLLLRNFSAYLESQAQQSGEITVLKEFYVRVTDSPLHLTFSATPPSSHAFLSGIEVVSVPEDLYVGPGVIVMVGDATGTQPVLPESTALENAYRLNVGGTTLDPNQDSRGLYRTWKVDDPFLIGGFQGRTGLSQKQNQIKFFNQTPNYSAPIKVYQTFRAMVDGGNEFKRSVNLTWGFEVDSGFDYLVRLHWCESVLDINRTGYGVFDVYIDDQIAEEAVDVFGWVGHYTAVYKDYYDANIRDGTGSSRRLLKLALHPNTKTNPMYYDVLLNGVEIFKINRFDGSLDAPNPSPLRLTNQTLLPQPKTKSAPHIIPVIIGVVVAGCILLGALLCCFLIFRKRKLSKTSGGASGTTSSKSKYFFSSGKSGTANKSGGGSSYLPSHLCRHFTLMDIRHATSDFSDSLIVGHGGFGNVYKGTINTESGPTVVAIKRLKAHSTQGAREFAMEIQLLSKLRHVNLVSLIGYCDDAGEMILVYEYMSHGTLKDHLYPNNTQLSWQERLEVCVGAARGLNYLHTGTDRMVIHRDVKSANILLDEAWMAKVADFGLSKLGPTRDDLSHVSTAVKGSFGYVDPEYYRRQQLTEKSDVYSFGVVLFEVLCGRAAVNPNLPKEQVNLRIWASRNQQRGTLDAIVDPKLVGQIAPESLRKFGEVAESCVRDEGARRPSMADVIGGLELALKLQMEDTVSTGLACPGDDKGNNTPDKYPGYTNLNITTPTTDKGVRLIRNSNSGESTWTSINNSTSGLFSSTASQGCGGSGPVFSEIFKPEGR
ncbi:hypothetical protein V2J09_013318 [Rumex salicifolius]